MVVLLAEEVALEGVEGIPSSWEMEEEEARPTLGEMWKVEAMMVC